MNSTNSAPTTTSALAELLDILALERLDPLTFQAFSLRNGFAKVFGGQLSAQALSAAQQTVDEPLSVHSLSVQFLRAGDPAQPLVISVERLRDARAFATRRIEVRQSGEPVCFATASFHIEEPGHHHQHAIMPVTAQPNYLDSERQIAKRYLDNLPKAVRAVVPTAVADSVAGERGFELRPVDHFSDPIAPDQCEPVQRIWFRATDTVPRNAAIHRRLLAFASDFHFLGTAMRPHRITLLSPGVSVASLDHSIWFHRAPRVDRWLLHDMESPCAGGARGFSRGQWFGRDGTLLASTAQEALVRDRRLS